MKYIRIFQNSQTLSVSVVDTYSEYQLMHTFLDHFHKSDKYSAQISSHHAELGREGNFTNQKYLYIAYLQTDYLNLDRASGCGKNCERENPVHTKCTFCGGANHSAENVSKGSERKKEISCGC